MMTIKDSHIHCYVQMTVEYEKFAKAIENILNTKHNEDTMPKINLALTQLKCDIASARFNLYDDITNLHPSLKEIEQYYRVSGNDM